MRQTFLEQSTFQQSQRPTLKKLTANELLFIIHMKKRFSSFKQDMHNVYENIFKSVPG